MYPSAGTDGGKVMDISFILNVPTLLALLEQSQKLTRVAVTLCSADGIEVARFGEGSFCAQHQSVTEEGRRQCYADNPELAAILRPNELVRCAYGLSHILIPVIVGGKQIGALHIGGVLCEPPDEEWFAEAARARGQDVNEVIDALRAVPVISGGEKSRLVAYFDSFVDALVAMAESMQMRQMHDEALRRSEDRFRSLVESAPMGIHLYEMSADGRLLFTGFNRAATQMLNTELASRVGLDIEEAFPGLKGTDIPAEYRRIAEGGESWHNEAVPYEYGGIKGFFDVYAFQTSFGRAAILFHEITERLLSEERLRLTQLSVDCASDAIFWMRRDGSFYYVNQAACRSLGYSYDELTRMSVEDIDPGYSTALRDELDRVLLEKGSVTLETFHKRKNGETFSVEVTVNLVDYFGNEYHFAFARDLSERKRAEEERVRLQQQMQQTQKLESLGILAGGIAHDFNNLLMGVLGNAELALMDLSQVSPVRSYMQDIVLSARRAADLCRQMLAYSGKGKFVIQSLNLNELVEEMAHLLSVSISKKAVLKCNFARELPLLEGDATQLRQVIMNLITNASDAIGDRSGFISITTGATLCSEEYLREMFLHENAEPGVYVFLEVADTGCGMNDDTQRCIFDPFFSTKFTGRGLGLAAVLGIVRGHKGAIRVYSEPNHGTTFRLLFPAADQPALIPANRQVQMNLWAAGKTILLVDDEETVRVVGGRMLKHIGFEVVIACDGREALALYGQHAERIGCVLLDLTMPHMDGEEAFRQLRRIREDLPILLSSGYNEQEVLSRFAGRGYAGFIQKPYQLDELEQKLRDVFEKPGSQQE